MNMKHIFHTLLLVALLGSCTGDEIADPTEIPVPEGKVKIALFSNDLNFEKPVSRTGTAQEELVDNNPLVLVFQGNGNAAVFAEAQKAYYSGGKSYVILTPTASKCRILIIGNPPSQFYNGTTTKNLTVAEIESALASTSFSDAVNNKLQTVFLSSSVQTTVPFVGDKLPMSAIVDVNSIDENTQFGTPVSDLLMKRMVAKVTVYNKDTSGDFVLHSATVVQTARNTRFWEIGTRPKSNALNLTDYYGTGADWAAKVDNVAKANASKNTEDNPIYIYETQKEQGTSVIVRGRYKGVEGYYRLVFKAANGTLLDIFRNKHYKFNIDDVNVEGYPTPTEALQNPPSTIIYGINAVDISSHEISDNGQYYLGLSHSKVLVQWFNMLTVADIMDYFNNEPAVIVTTDAPTTVTHSIKAVVTKSAEQIGFPKEGKLTFVTNGPTDQTLNITGNAVSTEIRITFDRNFEEGYLLIKVGSISKRVDVKRGGQFGSIEFMEEFTEDDSGYVSAEIESGHQFFNLSFVPDRKTGYREAVCSNPAGGPLYFFGDHYFTRFEDFSRSGTATFVRAKDSRRVKAFLRQMPVEQSGGFGYVATFHRHDQKGERLILMEPSDFDDYGRVPTVGAWEATILHGDDFIRIDQNTLGRNISDSNKTGWDAQNPETLTAVANSGPTISGYCDANTPIYFRIGLKDVIGQNETRFGAIYLSFNNDRQNFIIWVRQGEAPVAITGPAKWAVYNLADRARAAGGPNISNHSVHTSQASLGTYPTLFMDYPTQGGYFFQWSPYIDNNGTAMLRRYAFHPSNPYGETPIVGYPRAYMPVPSWSITDDPCPMGYKLPSYLDYKNGDLGGLVQSREYRLPSAPEQLRIFPINNQWGYCADGFFDRRPLENEYGTNAVYNNASTVAGPENGRTGTDIAFTGRVFFNIDTYASIFLPAGGHRNHDTGTAEFFGASGFYMTSSVETLLNMSSGNYVTGGGTISNRSQALIVRCIKYNNM